MLYEVITAAQRYLFDALATQLTLKAPALGAEPLELTLNSNLTLDLGQQQISVEKLVV